MKKKIFVLFMIAAAAGAFATGQQELNDDGVVELNRVELARNSIVADFEKVELTGRIVFESPVAELEVGSKQYTLMAPGAMAFYEYISEGDRITVTAYVMDEDEQALMGGRRGRMPMHRDLKATEGNTVLLVESVEIDGTVYELPWVGNGMGSRGGYYDCWNRDDYNDGSRGMRGGMRQSF